jgi:4a-hydroxytetrahydrobiopterin dehydratase
MSDLCDLQCKPCKGGVPPLAGEELRELSSRLPEWEVVEEHHLEREFRFDDYPQAVAFVNRIAECAEEQGHHPDILLTWGRVKVTVWTHKSNGLTENDFIYAAKCDKLRG